MISRYQFEIDESDPLWPELKTFLDGDHTFIRTRFTDKELSNTEWCIIRGAYSIEALRPEGYGYHKEYYMNQCSGCGAGWQQIKPFYVKREPKLGMNQFASFGSGFELFCTSSVLEEFARHGIRGVDLQSLLLRKSSEPSKELKQIVVTELAKPAIADDLVEHERYSQIVCPVCGRTWHAHYVRGMLPLRKSALKDNCDFQLTNEWFGNGRSARREILVSGRVTRLILENKWKGAELTPIFTV